MSTEPSLNAVFLDCETLGDVDFSPLYHPSIRWQFYARTASHQLLSRVQDAHIVVTNKVVLDQGVLQQACHLKLICIAATGTNNIDLQAAEQLGINVRAVRQYADSAVAQHTFTLILALNNQLLRYHQAVLQGQWSRSEIFTLLDYPFSELAGKTLGIVGYGATGKAVARLARAFDMQVMIAARDAHDNRPGRCRLEQLLPQVDILSLHCPLNDNTRHLIGLEQLQRMNSKALLINVARGGIVDEQALYHALRQGVIAGAAVDVLEVEPPPADHPLLQASLPNLIVTPHIAWAARETRQRLLNQVAENIRLCWQSLLKL